MIDDYAKFVDHTTSTESKDYVAFVDRLWALEDKANLPRLLTAVIGMQSETGEFAEIVKKCVFQGKEFDKDVKFHLMRGEFYESLYRKMFRSKIIDGNSKSFFIQ